MNSNVLYVLPSLFLMFCICPVGTWTATRMDSNFIFVFGILAGCAGVLILIYALFTGRVKLLG